MTNHLDTDCRASVIRTLNSNQNVFVMENDLYIHILYCVSRNNLNVDHHSSIQLSSIIGATDFISVRILQPLLNIITRT